MVSRSELINRMLSEQIDDPPYFKNNRMWTSLADFVKDNVQEVDEKIQIIDNCIWGKLIVMEKNTRIAKAYLRSPSIAVDGSTFEFDGGRLGLGAFSYLAANRSSHNLLSKIGKGIDIYVDFLGNVSLSNRTGRKIYVEAQDTKYDIGIYKEKIFDLRKFKQTVNKSNLSDKEMQKIKEGAIIWIQFAKGNTPLESPLWLCLIHVIAVEMVCLLSPQPSSSSAASSASSSSPKEHPSPPRWTAPRKKLSENFYEQCTRDDNNSVRDREEALYSMPEATAPAVTKRTASKEKVNSPRSTPSTCPTQSTEVTRLSRFTQHEHSAQKRGGVRKRLEKSLGPPMEKSNSTMLRSGSPNSPSTRRTTIAIKNSATVPMPTAVKGNSTVIRYDSSPEFNATFEKLQEQLSIVKQESKLLKMEKCELENEKQEWSAEREKLQFMANFYRAEYDRLLDALNTPKRPSSKASAQARRDSSSAVLSLIRPAPKMEARRDSSSAVLSLIWPAPKSEMIAPLGRQDTLSTTQNGKNSLSTIPPAPVSTRQKCSATRLPDPRMSPGAKAWYKLIGQFLTKAEKEERKAWYSGCLSEREFAADYGIQYRTLWDRLRDNSSITEEKIVVWMIEPRAGIPFMRSPLNRQRLTHTHWKKDHGMVGYERLSSFFVNITCHICCSEDEVLMEELFWLANGVGGRPQLHLEMGRDSHLDEETDDKWTPDPLNDAFVDYNDN